MSCERHCNLYKAVNGSWYMELADGEHEGQEEATTYGPFNSFEKAENYLDDNFSNPGGFWQDDSGKEPVPTKSPNGRPICVPRNRNRW